MFRVLFESVKQMSISNHMTSSWPASCPLNLLLTRKSASLSVGSQTLLSFFLAAMKTASLCLLLILQVRSYGNDFPWQNILSNIVLTEFIVQWPKVCIHQSIRSHVTAESRCFKSSDVLFTDRIVRASYRKQNSFKNFKENKNTNGKMEEWYQLDMNFK